jgi:hypothetical protein
MIMLISTLFSFIASGSKKSVDAISKMATLNGSRVTDPRYKPEIEFLPVEVGFKEMVSNDCCILVQQRICYITVQANHIIREKCVCGFQDVQRRDNMSTDS